MSPAVPALVPAEQGVMVRMPFHQQMLLIQTDPTWKVGGEVCRKGRAMFVIPLRPVPAIAAFLLQKGSFSPCSPIARYRNFIVSCPRAGFSQTVTMVCDCMSKCVPCPTCNGRAPLLAFQPAGAPWGSQGFGLGVKPKGNGTRFAR